MTDALQVIQKLIDNDDAKAFVAVAKGHGFGDADTDKLVTQELWRSALGIVIKAVYRLCVIRLRGKV